ncbi:hypothetical protein SteCoe_22158 [Stentor coeruleus]|uniref:RRM domain-containing protein n=1 Tax=Stentor coeruleus TaxID=5963 RepID=A0A1R2BN02_9CILI|nr:hypothetical protein SteCoe_22158 [Stentor coeruleus]
MEKKRWADISSSEEEVDISIESALDFNAFIMKYKNLKAPISLFIKNISFNCHSDQEISSWFTEKVNSQVFIIRNFKKIMFKGSAKVVVNSLELAYKLFRLSGQEYLGRPLEIKILDSEPHHLRSKHKSVKNIPNVLSDNKFHNTPRRQNIIKNFPTPINPPLKHQTFKKVPSEAPTKPFNFRQQNHDQCEENIKKISDIDPSIISVKVKPNHKPFQKSRRTQSSFNIHKQL